jgi:hypothetical protein
MRLFLLPIATRRSLIYCDKSLLQLAAQRSTARPSLIEKLQTKVTVTWASWERADGGWKKALTRWGDKMMRRIPYEEWGLKSIPALSRKSRDEALAGRTKPVEVVFPGLYMEKDSVEGVVATLAVERQALHRKRMIWSLIGAPLTLPCALIPM